MTKQDAPTTTDAERAAFEAWFRKHKEVARDRYPMRYDAPGSSVDGKWARRLYSPFGSYDQIVLTLGYPARDDHARRIVRPWRGFSIKTITHPHFGPEPVQVYAIDVGPTQ